MHPTSAISKELPQASNSKPAIVLVHGAFADGISWQHVIPLLEQDGYRVAKRIGAKTTEVNSSHVPFISHPKEVTKVIEAASTAMK